MGRRGRSTARAVQGPCASCRVTEGCSLSPPAAGGAAARGSVLDDWPQQGLVVWHTDLQGSDWWWLLDEARPKLVCSAGARPSVPCLVDVNASMDSEPPPSSALEGHAVRGGGAGRCFAGGSAWAASGVTSRGGARGRGLRGQVAWRARHERERAQARSRRRSTIEASRHEGSPRCKS